MFEMPPLPAGIRLLTDPEVERLRGKHPDLPHGPQQCVTCKGRGSFRWWSNPRREDVVEWKCNCIDQFMLHLYLLNANIGLAYQRFSWVDATAADAVATGAIVDYLDKAESYVNAGFGMILHGEKGNGKTLLCTLLVKALLAKGHDAYFTTFSEMIDTYTGGWNDADERKWFHRRIKNTGILVLDDVGREGVGRQKSGLPESTFDEVLRHRVAASKPTILTTNLSLTKLLEGYGGNVMSLLHERSRTYEFAGTDFRGQARERLQAEVDQELTRPVVIG